MFFKNKYRYWIVTALAVYTYFNTAFCDIYFYFKLPVHWYHALSSIFLITLFCWEWSRLAYPAVSKWAPGDANGLKRKIIFFIVGVTGSSTFTISLILFYNNFILSEPANLANPLKLTLIYSTLITLLFHLLNAVFHYMKQYRTKELEAEALKRENIQAQLQALQLQINPHFLFNNLNVLSTLILKESGDANKFIEEFSKVYQYVLSNHGKELIELKKELDFIKPYKYLLEKRFQNGLKINIDIPEKYDEFYIVPIALQMLIENAIKHNIVSQHKPLNIDIHANGNNILVVKNNLQPKLSKEKSSSIGLHNINQRYQMIAGKKIEVLENEEEFSVSLPLIG